jgi:hypothetical protein
MWTSPAVFPLALGAILAAGSGVAAEASTGLRPSTTTLAVGYREGPRSDVHVVRTPGGEVPITARAVAGRVTMVTLAGGGRDGDVLDSVRDALLRDFDVRYVYRALIHVSSGQILLPTDQILIKVRQPVERVDVARRLPSVVTVVRPLEGTDDEYVLALTDPRAADPVAVAAALARENWIAWAEPDFVREYSR